MKVVDDILGLVDSGSVVALIGLDISAAFDTINHNMLLDRLRNDYGIYDDALEWISLLSDGQEITRRRGLRPESSRGLCRSCSVHRLCFSDRSTYINVRR